MNEDQHQALCKACDELLLAGDSSDELVATPWLHVIRPHSIFFERYSDVFEPRTLTGVKRQVRNVVASLRSLGKSLVRSGKLWVCIGQLPPRCDVVMVSHLVSETSQGQQEDFYYGTAADDLRGHGISATIALINHTDTDPTILAKNWRCAEVPRIIFTPVLGFAPECSLYWRANSAAHRLKRSIPLQKTDFVRKVTARAASETSSASTVATLRLGEQIKALVSRLQPRAIVVTYEGHSFERIAFSAARSILPQIHCIGYQHAALFNLQHAIQRRLADKFNPDLILTAGGLAQAKLQSNPQLQGVRVETLGSNRSFSRGPARTERTRRGARRACLVLPEGITSECNLLFGFTLQCALLMPDIEFIWRLHPNMSPEALTPLNSAFPHLPANIKLSTDTLAGDIARSLWALYRGSTSIVQAAVSGIRPIYLHQVGEVQIDPLYEIAELRAQVVDPGDFKALVAEVETEDTLSKAEKVQDYCERMFTPMDTRVLAEFIAETNEAFARS